MRKSKRILTSFLAIALVLSNLSLSTLTVNATEATDMPMVVEEQDDAGSVSQNAPGSENPVQARSVSQNEPENMSVSGNTPGTTPPSDGNGEGGGTAPDQGEGGGSTNEVILNFNQLGTNFGYGCKPTVDEATGAAKFVFNNGGNTHGEARYNLPADFDTSHVTKAELVLEDGSGVFIKLFLLENAGGYTFDQYNNAADCMYEYGSPSVAPSYQFKSIGICSPADVNEVTISGIRFTYGDVELQEKEAPPTSDDTEKPAANEYKISDLTLVETTDVVVTEAEDGSAAMTFKGNWKSLFIEIPKALSDYAIDKITFNVTSDNAGSFGYKTFTAEKYDTDKWGSQTDVSYGNTTLLPAGDTKADLKYLAITSNFAGEASDEEIQMTISGISFEYSEVVEGEPAETTEITYNFKDLENVNSYGVTLTVSDGGELKAEYNGQYQETFYKVPDTIDPAKVKKVELLLADGSGVTIKLYPNANGSGDAQVNYTNSISPSVEFLSFGIMNLADGANTIKASGVKFTVADTIDNLEINKTYTFNEINESRNGGVAKSVDSATGAVTLGFNANYQEIFFAIPKEIDASKVHKVTFKTTSENAQVTAYKFYTEEGFTTGNWPSTNKVSYGNPVVVENTDNLDSLDDTKYFGIMSCKNIPQGESWTEEDNYSITFDSVTFHTSGWGYMEEPEEDPDVYYGDNIIKNPNFAEEDLSMWTMGTSKSVISKETAEKAIFDEVSTYGKIDRDATWSIPANGEQKEQDARHEFFAQDITEAIKADGDLNRRPEYKVEFYAMLSDDYKDAPAEQRVVEFAPYIITEQGDHEYLGVSYSSQLSGNLSQTLEAGKWTKFSGTFSVSHSGTINQVVIRVVEQGTEYGDIAAGAECVKGDFYITGVSMTEVFKPETVIQTDIPNWKDAITAAFGKDAIAGTCLGRGTITYDYLQELAKKHFNAITFENEQKPDITLGSTPNIGADGYPILNFNAADSMMAQIKEWNDEDLNDNINFKIRGHVLVWHSQTPEWFFHENYDTSKDFVTPEVMNLRLENYIKSVFDHYKSVVFEDGTTAADMFYGWDVVNEAMSDSTGKPRKTSDSSNWARVYGEESNEYIINAFRYANKYAPENIKLFYNDYNDSNEPKASGIAALAAEITAHEKDAVMPTRIDGIGMQAHHNFADPTVSQIKSAINKYLDALGEGGTVQMTEFDVKKSATFDGTAATLESEHNKQAWRFKEIFDAYRDINVERPGSVSGITMWGITDETSWLQNNNTVGGASSGGAQAPLLFYIDNYVAKAKPAFYAFFDDYVADLAPMIQSVTVMQQMKEDNFDIGLSYGVAGAFDFVPMWTEDGLAIKVFVTDATNDGANDKIVIYLDEANSKSEGDYVVASVARNAAGVTSTANGYETVVTIPMEAKSAKIVGLDVTVEDNGEVVAFNDKKNKQATTSQYYAEAIMKPYAEIMNGTVAIDGEMDAAWANAQTIPLTIVLGAEASASVKALWDAEYLYVYAEVKDAVLDATASAVHEKDSVEVFIDENNAKAEAYQADDKQYRVNYLNEQSFNGTKCTAENMISAMKVTDDGYVMEAAYKWTDITPAKGMEIGIEFQINDAKNGARTGTASWYDTTGQGYQNPSVFGTAVLVDATSEPTTPSKPSQGGSGSSSSGSSSSSSSSSSTVKPEEKPVETPVVETPATGTSSAGTTVNDAQAEETATETTVTESVIPEAVANVVEQVKTLVDADATPEEKVEAVQEVIDTVKELVQNEEVKELASETISSIEETIKEALGIDTKVDSKGDNVPEVKSVIGALLSVDAGKQPTLSVEALGADNTPALEAGFVNAFPLEIKLFADDEEVQPNVPVTIRMGIPSGVDKDKEIKVVHFGQNGTDTLDTKVFGDEMEFTTDGFSTFVVVNVESAAAVEEAAPADENVAEEVADDDATVSAIEEPSDDNGFTTFIIIVIVVALLAVAAAGFFVLKNKKKE